MRYRTQSLVCLALASLPALARQADTLTLESMDPPAASSAMAPFLAASGHELLMTWLEPAAEGTALRFSRLRDNAWADPVTVAEGRNFFANWADTPGVAVAGDGSLVAWWLQKSGSETYAYDIRLARSEDRGTTWRAIGKLNDDNTRTEHGFVSMVPEALGLRAFWLDGRNTTGDHAAAHAGAMTLRTALVTDTPGPSAELDAMVCDCCPTAAVAGPRGPAVVYRDRSDFEVRDISIVGKKATGWTAPSPVHEDNWMMPGCPVNGPVAVGIGEAVGVAWFTGATPGARVLAAFAPNDGAPFGPPIVIDADEGEGAPLGRVAATDSGPSGMIVCWLDGDGPGHAALRLRRVGSDGKLSEVRKAARTTPARASGTPRLVRIDERLFLAWTEDARPSRVRVVVIPLDAIP